MAEQSTAPGVPMRYTEFAKLCGVEQTRHMAALDWKGRFLLCFEALLEMERKYEVVRGDLKIARAELVEWKSDEKLVDRSGVNRAEQARAVAQRNQEIRTVAREEHLGARELGERFGVSQNYVASVLRGPLRVEQVAERMECAGR